MANSATIATPATTTTRRKTKAEWAAYARRATVYHEAGHGVAALAMRLRFRYVTVRPDPTVGSSGHCWVGRWPRHLDLEHDRPERLEPRVRKEIITAFG